MAVNVKILAEATVHWIEFERLCGRDNLLSESYLRHPIGQCLNARSKNPVKAEFSHPVLGSSGTRGRDKQLDFVIRTRNENTITDSFETKWVTDKRDFKQEIFDDLVRLELIHEENRDNGRWFLIAGRYSHLRAKVLEAEGNIGGGLGRVRVFENVLPTQLDQKQHVDIAGSQNPARAFWKKTEENLKHDVPKSFNVTLKAQFPEQPTDDDVCCMIWRIGRSSKRQPYSLK